MTKPLTKEEKDARAKARAAGTKPKAKSEKRSHAKKPSAKKGDKGEPTLKQAKEVDLSAIDVGKARKRLGAIYKLKKNLAKKQALFDLASRNRRAAKAELEEAQAELDREIEEQRVGPGPLFGANPETLPKTGAAADGKGGDGDADEDEDEDGEGEAA